MNEGAGTKINRRLVMRIAIGVVIVGLIAGMAGVFIFRNMLRPGQQQRVINILPFMETFLWRPPENYSLPTPLPATNAMSPEDLLSITLELPTRPAPTETTSAALEGTVTTLTPSP